MQEGSVEQEQFNATVPFEFRAGIPVMQVEVNGEKGWFLFDTGAPNVISKEFAARLNLQAEAKGRINDSGGNSTTGNDYISLDKFTIGGVSFLNTGGVVQDLRASDIFKCLNIDGIIGANLMRQAFWKLDYTKETISLSSHINDFALDSTYMSMPFDVKFTGTPIVDIELAELTVKKMIFDTGSNGHFSMPLVSLKALQDTIEVKTTWELGATSYGVGGKALSDTIFYAVIDTMHLGEISVPNNVVAFAEHSDNFGNEFFKNYDVILDWDSRQIYMREVSPYDNSVLETHGFGVNLTGGQMLVGSIFAGSSADGKLEIDDQIIRIDEYLFDPAPEGLICELVNSREIKFRERDSIQTTVKRGEETITFELERMKLLGEE
jgi:hypothetical protein